MMSEARRVKEDLRSHRQCDFRLETFNGRGIHYRAIQRRHLHYMPTSNSPHWDSTPPRWLGAQRDKDPTPSRSKLHPAPSLDCPGGTAQRSTAPECECWHRDRGGGRLVYGVYKAYYSDSLKITKYLLVSIHQFFINWICILLW